MSLLEKNYAKFISLVKFLMQPEAMNIFNPCMNALLEILDPSCLGLKLRDVKF